jgi:hypothetical protein
MPPITNVIPLGSLPLPPTPLTWRSMGSMTVCVGLWPSALPGCSFTGTYTVWSPCPFPSPPA